MPTCVFCNTSVAAGSPNCPKCGAALRFDDEPARQPSGPAQPDDLLALAREGRTIEAIKLYREQTGTSLREAKDAIERLVATGRLPENEGETAASDLGDGFEGRLLNLLRAGQKIEAIKEYRQRTGAGLRDAKESVEALAARNGIISKSAGCAGMVLLLVLTGSLTIWVAAQ